jgi:hypothetical protein
MLVSKRPRRSVICPICQASVDTSDQQGIGHFLTHLDDVERGNPSSGLALACGCPDATWPTTSDFPGGVIDHLKRAHGLKL